MRVITSDVELTSPQRIQLLLTSASFSENTGSNKAFEWALTQYKNCLATHSTCPNQTVAKLPARVLALGDLETGSLDLTANVRIHESIDEQNTYACLSHCWGVHLPIKLTKENLASFRNNIPWSALPKSFQDAIAFTRKLRIPYIWIDSLCILQDDEEDWREQSAQMAEIYENSVITLAASAAENGAAGCFLHPSPTTQQVSPSVSNNPKILIKESPWHPDLDAKDAQDKEHIPLFSRGWAYQERILAPKVLHFGPQELFWECNNGASCECGKLKASPKAAHQRALQSSLNSVLSYRWRDIVSEYTSRELTYTSDKLPAIAGVAKQFMGRMEVPNYLAGLWGQSLVEDMMWRVDSP
ncbi:heterokaryon incompatibility protein-domain-containing protein, partial [Bisporella sp. PMI_857]